MSDPQPSNQVQELQIPEFKSNIPEYILNDIKGSDKEHLKYILETISIIQQQSNWQTQILAQTFQQAKKTNGRVNKLEEKLEEKNDEIQDIQGILAEDKDSVDDIKDIKKLLSKKWFIWGGALILVFFAFFIYPYLLSLGYKELIPIFRSFFG